MRARRQTEFVPAKTHAKLTTGEVIRMLRELKGWTQARQNLPGVRASAQPILGA